MPPTCCREQGLCPEKGKMQVVTLGDYRARGWENQNKWIEHSWTVSLLVHSQRPWLSLLSLKLTNMAEARLGETSLSQTPLCW